MVAAPVKGRRSPARSRARALVVVLLALALPVVAPATARAAGLDVASYDPAVGAYQVQALLVIGTTGTYTLAYRGSPTTALPAQAPTATVQAALEAVGATVTVTDGPLGAGPSVGTTYTLTFADPAEVAVDVVATTSAGGGLPAPQVSTQCVRCLDTSSTGPATGNGAAVLFVHSGGYLWSNRAEADAIRSPLEAAGYRVFSMNYRMMNMARFAPTVPLLPGCAPWTVPSTQLCTDWLAAADDVAEDVNLAVSWLKANAATYGFDPAKVAVVGFSAGAISALSNHYEPVAESGRPAVTVSLSGIMDPARVQPNATAALLLDFGGADTTYGGGFLAGIDPQQNAEQIAMAARAKGEVIALRTYAGSGHMFNVGTPQLTDAVGAVLQFFNRRLFGFTNDAGVWFGQATGFTKGLGQQFTTPGFPTPVPVLGDFDGDGRGDALWYGEGSAPDAIWYGDAGRVLRDPVEWSGSFASYAPAVDVGGTYAPVTGDLDGDGRDDIVWLSPTDGLATMIWYGNADRTFTVHDVGNLFSGLDVRIGDFSGDGSDDVVLYSATLHGIVLARSTGPRGAFSIVNVTGGVAPGPPPFVGDYDGDGRADLYWRQLTGMNTWYGNAGTGAAAFVPAIGQVFNSYDRIVPGDYDGDGRTDLFFGTPGGPGSVVYGEADRSFTPPYASLVIETGADVRAGDIDGDGLDDLVWLRTDGRVRRALASATRAWPAPVQIALVSPTLHFAVGDLDGVLSTKGHRTVDVLWYE